MPAVSVIIPAYNRADLLAQAMDSVLAQTMSDLELIVVDDGSTDDTPAVAAQLAAADSRVRTIRQENQGRSAARNAGLAAAQGSFIGLLDSDDTYLPNTLALHLAAFEAQTVLGMTLGGMAYVDLAGQPLGLRQPWLEGGGLTLRGWLYNCYGIPGAALVRREWAQQVGGFDTSIHSSEDWDYFLRLALLGCPMGWVRAPVVQYRQHPGGSYMTPAGIRAHRHGVVTTLGKAFASPHLAPDQRAIEGAATGWAHIQIAKMWLLAGDTQAGVDELRTAAQLWPAYRGAQRLEVLEHLLKTPPDGWAQAGQAALTRQAGALTDPLGLRPGDMRRARARVEMAAFFRLRTGGDQTRAAAHLRRGLRLDPTWLANRGVLSFLIGQKKQVGNDRLAA